MIASLTSTRTSCGANMEDTADFLSRLRLGETEAKTQESKAQVLSNRSEHAESGDSDESGSDESDLDGTDIEDGQAGDGIRDEDFENTPKR